MKNLGKLILIFLFFLLATSPTMAVRESTGAGNRQVTSQEIRQQTKERIQERIATIEARLSARKKEIIGSYFLRMTKRLEAAISRLNRLITRIELRIAKIEANNEDIDTKPIKNQVQKAKDKLQVATDKLNEAKIKIDDILESGTPKEAFAGVRDLIKEIKQILIDVHQILVKVIGDIKGLRVGTTSTPSATTE